MALALKAPACPECLAPTLSPPSLFNSTQSSLVLALPNSVVYKFSSPLDDTKLLSRCPLLRISCSCARRPPAPAAMLAVGASPLSCTYGLTFNVRLFLF